MLPARPGWSPHRAERVQAGPERTSPAAARDRARLAGSQVRVCSAKQNAQEDGMSPSDRTAIETAEAPSPAGSYSQGMVAGGLLFIAGQVPIDPGTGVAPAEFDQQVRQTLDNLSAVARAAGASLRDAVRVGVYLTDLARFEEMDGVYREYFSAPMPVRTTIGTAIRGLPVEMDAVVAVDPLRSASRQVSDAPFTEAAESDRVPPPDEETACPRPAAPSTRSSTLRWSFRSGDSHH